MGAAGILLIMMNLDALIRQTCLLVLIPLALIHVCAFINGYFMEINVMTRHLARLLASAAIFALFYTRRKTRV
jgi:hypothetical protein